MTPMTALDRARLAGRIDKLISDADSLSAEDFAVAALPVLFDASAALREAEKAVREIEFLVGEPGFRARIGQIAREALYRIGGE